MTYDDLMAKVADRVRGERLARGWSYREAGERSGVPFQTITRIETGKTAPTPAVLHRLAVAYGVSVRSFWPDGLATAGPPAEPKGKGRRRKA